MRKKSKLSVKEAFDNLPAGLCFFNSSGLPVLCNRTMNQLVYALTGRDLQHISELTAALEKPASHVTVSDGVYRLSDGSAWSFSCHTLTNEAGEFYTEYLASDVSALCSAKAELEADNTQLREMANQLRRLSANAAIATREEEILSLKMRVHDQMGRSLVAARRLLVQDSAAEQIDPIVEEWQNAVALLRHAGDEREEATDMLSELNRISNGMIKIITTGKLPEDPESSYTVMTAIRECVTNALRYAHASELYAAFSRDDGCIRAVITNNGAPPEKEITEGGGLSSLRRRIESRGGRLEIRSLPAFELKVIMPIGKENNE